MLHIRHCIIRILFVPGAAALLVLAGSAAAAEAVAPAWVQLDIAAACTADLISTETHEAANQLTLEGSRLASASWLRKNGFPEPGLPDDGRVPIPGATPPGNFQVRMPPSMNAIILSGPEGTQPQPVTIELASSERLHYTDLAVLHCTCWGHGKLRALFRYDTGEPMSATMTVVDWTPKGIKGNLTRTGPLPAELRVAVTSRDTRPKWGPPVEMLAQRIPVDPNRVLRSVTFSFESLTPGGGRPEEPARKRFKVAVFAISGRTKDSALLRLEPAGTSPTGVPLAPASRVSATATDAKLAFKADDKNNLIFDTGMVKGSVIKDGLGGGLKPLTFGEANVPVDNAHGLLVPYRFLTCTKRYGVGSWEWPHTGKLLDDGAAELRWAKSADRPFVFSSTMRWKAPDTLDLTLAFTPDTNLEKFELFLGSYFRKFTVAKAYVKDAGNGQTGFLEAAKNLGGMQLFPRNQEILSIVNDGRWTFPPAPNEWAIRPALEAPLGVRQDPNSGVTVILMSRADECFAVSMSQQEASLGAYYLSLFGKDVKHGQTLTAHVRLVFGKNITDSQAIQRYQEYIKDRSTAGTKQVSWTDLAGRTIQGDFLRLGGQNVVILKDGKEIILPFAKLSPASVVRAKKLATPAAE